ncbi:hypothetical protein [Secundilactobacillus yichangensis]|uniref:hypothetical protein n=1 Tax=Secundilactobacillus yichangensis TaxID=2799580 RepID=UPI001942C21F|nr:hypothetical protein [Secundilactobacillus yichangensis]
MAKKQFVDKDGRKFVEVTPWYKQWWVWVMAVVAIIVIIGLLGGRKSSSKDNLDDTASATAHTTTKNEKGSAAKPKTKKSAASTITVDDNHYDVLAKKTYRANYTDSSWSAAKVKVDKVTVYKLAKAYKYNSTDDGKFDITGYVRLHVIISPTRDIDAYATQGTVVYSNGEQHDCDTMEDWDGEIARGATKAGDVTLPIEQLANINSLKTLRFKFDTDYETDNDDDENSDHTYDFTLNLNK